MIHQPLVAAPAHAGFRAYLQDVARSDPGGHACCSRRARTHALGVQMLPLALALSVLIGVSLGLLGGGGSILTTPILIYAIGL